MVKTFEVSVENMDEEKAQLFRKVVSDFMLVNGNLAFLVTSKNELEEKLEKKNKKLGKK